MFLLLLTRRAITEHNSQLLPVTSTEVHKDSPSFLWWFLVTCHAEKTWIIRSCVLDMNPSLVITDGYQTEAPGRELYNFILNSGPNRSALQFILSKTISSLC